MWLHLVPPGCSWVQEDSYMSAEPQEAPHRCNICRWGAMGLHPSDEPWEGHVPVNDRFNCLIFVWPGLRPMAYPFNLLWWKVRIERIHVLAKCMREGCMYIHTRNPNGPLSVISPLTKLKNSRCPSQVPWTKDKRGYQIRTYISIYAYRYDILPPP